MKRDQLNVRQERFVAEYLVNGNGTRAAITAGYSRRTAESQASSLLRNPKVSQAVEAGRQRLKQSASVTLDDLVNELKKIAFAPIPPGAIHVKDKRQGLADLAKLLGFWWERREVDTGPTLLELIEASQKPRREREE